MSNENKQPDERAAQRGAPMEHADSVVCMSCGLTKAESEMISRAAAPQAALDEIVYAVQAYGDARADGGDSADAIGKVCNLLRAIATIRASAPQAALSDEEIFVLADDFKSTEMACGVPVEYFDSVGFAHAILGLPPAEHPSSMIVKHSARAAVPQAELSDEEAWMMFDRICAENKGKTMFSAIGIFARALLATAPTERAAAPQAAREGELTEVGFITQDEVLGWHFSPTVAWSWLGKGRALYARKAEIEHEGGAQ